jgi:hypothetical protein
LQEVIWQFYPVIGVNFPQGLTLQLLHLKELAGSGGSWFSFPQVTENPNYLNSKLREVIWQLYQAIGLNFLQGLTRQL